jgi:hypothetical protein
MQPRHLTDSHFGGSNSHSGFEMMKIEATPLPPVSDRCKMRRHVAGSLTLREASRAARSS